MIGEPTPADHFRHHGHRDFLRRHGSYFQAHRGVDLRKPLGWDPLSAEMLGNFDRLALRADHPDVTKWLIDRPPQDPHVIAMAARHDDRVGGVVGCQLREDLFILCGDHLGRFREPLLVRVGLPVVDDGSREPGEGGNFREALGNVPGTENQRTGYGQHGFHVNIELAAANQAVVICGILAEMELQHARFFGVHDIPRRLPDFSLCATPSDRSDHRTVFAD